MKTRYLIDFRRPDGSKDFGIVTADDIDEALMIAEDLGLEPFKVSLRDYNNERNGAELVLWEAE